jgi:iron complex outermembrane recepter protein
MQSIMRRLFSVALFTNLALPSVFSQAIQPPATNADADPRHVNAAVAETPIELTPFEIREDKDKGYAAQNTISGSRLNTSLKDTPAAISVFTAQFIQDIGATNIDDLVDYAVNTSNNVLDGGNGALMHFDPIISIRGIDAQPGPAGGGNGRFTNFFPSNFSQDSFNMQRAELTRGPNSVLYGVGLPAGGFNVTTKKADVNRPSYSLGYRFGSYNQARGAIDLNRPIVQGRLALRFNAVDEDRNDWHAYAFKHDVRWATALRWQVSRNIKVDVEHERGQRNFATASGNGVTDALTPWIAAGRRLDTQVGQAFPANAGMIRNASGNKVTYDMTTGQLWNLQNQSQGAQAGKNPAVPLATGEQARMFTNFDLVPRNVFLGGPAYRTTNNYNRSSVFGTYEITRRLSVEGAYNRESYILDGHNPIIGNGSEINVDTNSTLPDGRPNPNAGRYYVDAVGGGNYERTFDEGYRFSTTYQHDFTDRPGLLRWLGSHRFLALAQRELHHNKSGALQEFLIVNAQSTASPDNAANQVVRRTYFDLDGPVGQMGMADVRRFPIDGLINLSTGRPVTSAILPGGQPRVNTDWKNTLLLVWQGHLFKDRLVPMIGYRKDRFAALGIPQGAVRGPAVAPFTQGIPIPVQNTEKDFGFGITRTQGVVLHTVKWASFFYNHSSSFSLPPAAVRLFQPTFAPSGNAFPVSTAGVTDDFGGKFSLMQGKLFATVTYYETQVNNQYSTGGLGTWKNGSLSIWQTLDAAGILRANNLSLDQVSAGTSLPQGRQYDQLSTGWEFEFVANPTANWTLLLNYSTNKTIQTNTATEILGYVNANKTFWTEGTRGRLVVNGTPGQLAANAIDAGDGVTTIAENVANQLSEFDNVFKAPEGARTLGVPINQANLRTSYSFREGRLRGFAMGLGVRFRGQRVLAYTSTDPATRREIRTDPDWTTDANFNYRRNVSLFNRKLGLHFQLNFTNLLNDRSVIYTRAYADGVMRTYSIPAPRAWFLTTTANF